MTREGLNNLARELMLVRSEIEMLQSQAEAMQDRLKAEMTDRCTEVLVGDGWKATWKNVQSKRFDSKSFKADHADLYSEYSKPVTSTRFVLTA